MSTPSEPAATQNHAVTQLPTPFYQSRTFWVSLLGCVLMVATYTLGDTSTPETTAQLNNFLGAEGILITAIGMAIKIFSGGKKELVDDTQISPEPTSSEDNKKDTPCPGSGNTSESAGSGSFSSLSLLLIGAVSAGTLLATSCSSGLSVNYDPDTGAAAITRDGKTVIVTVNPQSDK